MSVWMNDARKAFWHLRHGGFSAYIRRNTPNRKPNQNVVTSDDVVARVSRRWWGGRSIGFTEASVPEHHLEPKRADLTVAVILDEFSLEAFKFEWNQIPLMRSAWREQLGEHRPDILFVESAWAGNGGEWRYQLTGKNGVKDDFRELVAACNDLGIPTVFWNKEDPPHYADFLDAARIFDHVFTSDADRVENYVRDLGHGRVGVLTFAAQPALHNPVRPRRGWHERDVAFAGMYFVHKFPERRQQLDLLLAASIAAGHKMRYGLEIFSRNATEDKNYQFPDKYKRNVVGSLSYREMLNAYKAYKLFLNVNSVVDSPSMCARRIFEITAAGTSVISTPSRALTNLWPDGEQFVVTSQEQAEDVISAICRNPDLSDRQLHLAQRRIWNDHTYGNRVEQIVGVATPEKILPSMPKTVSVLVSSIRPNQLENIYRTVGSFVGVEVELVLSTHGFCPDEHYMRHLAKTHGVASVVHLVQPAHRSLGACLQNCVAASSGYYITKMDDDDFYGPSYLMDLIHALSFSGADIVGKQAHYMYLASRNATILRFSGFEHRFTSAVMGPTITGQRSVFEDLPFKDLQRGEDTAFLESVRRAGGSIYSSDRFNYSQYRGSAEHTWKVSEDRLLTTGDLTFFGSPQDHIVI